MSATILVSATILGCLLPTIVGCGQSGSGAAAVLSDAERKAVVAAATALDARWSEAARRGDVAAALGCFRSTESFSFNFDGGLISSFAEFEDLVRRSYAARTGFEATNVARRVSALSSTVAAVAGQCDAVETTDDSDSRKEFAYGFMCRKEAEGWRIVNAYEFAVE